MMIGRAARMLKVVVSRGVAGNVDEGVKLLPALLEAILCEAEGGLHLPAHLLVREGLPLGDLLPKDLADCAREGRVGDAGQEGSPIR